MLVPKLRFPEFRETGEWGQNTLDNICSSISAGKDKGNSNGKYDLYGSTGVIGKTGNGTYDGRFILASSVGANVGLLTKATGKFGVADNAIVIILKKSANIDFVFFSLEKFGLNKMVLGAGQPLITGGKLKELAISLPAPEEQKKVTDCLSSIDELISAQSQEIEVLKTHKKGLMQKLFPRDGETVPRLRFPEFRDAGDWKRSTLGEIATITSGGTSGRSKQEYWGGNIPWVTSTLIDFNVIHKAKEFISAVALKESSSKIFPKNTILMAMSGQGISKGKVAVLGIDAAISQACAAILLKREINTDFVFHNLAGRYDEIRELSNQGALESLSAGLIAKISFSYPNNDAEQQKIANCLVGIDDLLAAQIQKLVALKIHKKGLMQQLFPLIDEEEV